MVPVRTLKRWMGVLLFLVWAWPVPAAVQAQLGVLGTYEVEAEAAASNDNYVRSRKRAVSRALRAAVDQALKDLLGEKAHSKRNQEIRKILNRARDYVKSYRFLEVVDDETESLSRVRLEVVVFTDALNKQLNSAGLVSSTFKEKAVVVLIRERSFTGGRPARFWESVPMSEVALAKHLVAAGIEVVGRDQVQGVVSEERVAAASRGDISAAVDIGLKAGAEIVIVGNAASNQVRETPGGTRTVQANLSIQAVSVLQSGVIAAKSDFATARDQDPVSAELQAFDTVGQKMARFLADVIQRFWKPEPVAAQSGASPPAPAPSTPPAKAPPAPGGLEDL